MEIATCPVRSDTNLAGTLRMRDVLVVRCFAGTVAEKSSGRNRRSTTGGRMPATRVGLVGAGGVAQRHARVLSALPEVQLAAVTDVVPEAAAELAGEYGARALPDVTAL